MREKEQALQLHRQRFGGVHIVARHFQGLGLFLVKNVYEHAASAANNNGVHFKSEIGGG
jgi:hypothetical protein